DRTAQTDVPILDVLAERWSTRVFDAEAPIDEEALRAAFEAARWSPSANNTQPWRFIVGRRGTDAHAKIVESLVGFNQGWAPAAGALIVVLVETADAEGNALPWATYD
ncbi:nitroreductase family protein, partial [Lactococcus lactis]|uniref:nitroreductase family protein n=1 Tax=Lactococcus lactis TaxID=1358 RepID=UPI003D14D533